MSLTKRWLESQPNEQQALEAAQHSIGQAARIINADCPLDWADREAVARALHAALSNLTQLEEFIHAQVAY